jgi:hypothetical protein
MNTQSDPTPGDQPGVESNTPTMRTISEDTPIMSDCCFSGKPGDPNTDTSAGETAGRIAGHAEVNGQHVEGEATSNYRPPVEKALKLLKQFFLNRVDVLASKPQGLKKDGKKPSTACPIALDFAMIEKLALKGVDHPFQGRRASL